MGSDKRLKAWQWEAVTIPLSDALREQIEAADTFFFGRPRRDDGEAAIRRERYEAQRYEESKLPLAPQFCQCCEAFVPADRVGDYWDAMERLGDGCW